MYPYTPQDAFFVRAILDELARTMQRIVHEWRAVHAARTPPWASGRRRVARRTGHLLVRSSRWLLRLSP